MVCISLARPCNLRAGRQRSRSLQPRARAARSAATREQDYADGGNAGSRRLLRCPFRSGYGRPILPLSPEPLHRRAPPLADQRRSVDGSHCHRPISPLPEAVDTTIRRGRSVPGSSNAPGSSRERPRGYPRRARHGAYMAC